MSEAHQLKFDAQQSFSMSDGTAQSSYDPATRTMRVRWLSQAEHVRYDWMGSPFLMRLHPEGCDLSRANAGGPFKFTHRNSQQSEVIGNIVENSMTLSAECEGLGEVRLIEFPDDELKCVGDDQRAAMKVAKRYLRPISMDASLTRTTITEFPEEPGRMPEVDVWEWEVATVSAVFIQQDPKSFTMEASMPSPIQQPNQTTPEPAAPAAVITPTTPPAPNVAEMAAATEAAIYERQDQIHDMAVVFGLNAAEEKKLARSKEPLSLISKRLIEEKAKAGDAQGISASTSFTRDEGDTIREAIVEAFEARIGHQEPTEKAKRFAGRRIDHVAREYLKFHGVSNAETMDEPVVIERAIGFGAGGMLAPSDLPVLLVEGTQRVLNKLVAEQGPANWMQLCRMQTVNDFREIKMARRLFSGTVKEIATNGSVEYPFTNDETWESGKAKAWGGGIQLGREALINDDLSTLEGLPADILQAITEHQTNRFWSQFLTGTLRDGKALCHADHKNVVASGGAGPGQLTQLAKMRLLFKQAKDGDSLLRLRLTHLIVPEVLYDEAAQIVSGQITATEAAKTVPSDYRGLTIISDTLLDENSATKWYAAAAGVKCFTFLRLRGAETPQIQQERDFNSRGLKIAGFYDYNIVPTAYQGIASNKGAA